VKFIGYETYVKQVSLGVDETTRLVVSIKPNTKDLGSVVIVAKKDAQWRKYLKEF